ncbi:MAG: TonB-dependent receptor [Bdellovibrio sp. ArHS]|uniref:TonB-dependent receptor n=1 Tax=Bdellovibrio sp. ArHS TaxID=1569284 RepID=UPI000583009A|nr:TonB-dependent receptor [Bdellovibrio sp. ArHS]KHD89648.1 MAG: TonB-dependent receptor [Bdellovibrio sp. ArHS]
MKSIVFILLLIPTVGRAQEESQPSQIESIQVQGHKENKTYQESAESISVLKSNEVDAPVQKESLQVINASPNVTVNKNDDSFSIRGINNTGVTGFQKDNLSSVLIDNVFQTDLAIKAGSFELWDTDQLELYRGPQSTTQGVNSLAGSILLFHNKPTADNEVMGRLGYGSYNRLNLSLLGNTAWLEGALKGRISYNHDQDDGFIKNLATNNSKWGKKSKKALTLDLVYDLNATDFLRWNSKLFQNETGGNYVQSSNPFDYEVDEDVDSDSKTTNQQTSLTYSKQINESWRNEAVVAFSLAHNDETSDADGTRNPTAGVRTEEHQDRFVSFENLLKYQSGSVKNVLGFHAHDYYLNDRAHFNILYPVSAGVYTPVDSTQETEKYRTVFALFDSYLWKFTSTQSLNLGLRYEYVKNKYGATVTAKRTQNLGGGVNAAIDNYLNSVSGSYEDTNDNSILLPKAAYTVTNGAHSYSGSYSEGYRTGGLSINRKRAKVDSYDPEKTSNYELSYKWSESFGTLSSNVFYTDWKDQQVQIQLSNDIFDTQVVNAASSEVYGAEVELQMQPVSRHQFTVGAGYVKTRFKDFVSGSKDYSGNEFPFAPNWTGKIHYLYHVNSEWTATSTVRYLGTSYGNAENTLDSPEQFYWDASVQYAMNAWNMGIDFYVRNLLNSQYVIYDRTSSIGGQTVNYKQVNSPQELGVTLSWYL